MRTAELIRHIDGVELPTTGWWGIAPQRIGLRTLGLRRRTMSGTASGALTLAADPGDSTIDLLVSPGDGRSPDLDLAIHATMTSTTSDGPEGLWRFSGSVEAAVTAPIAVDVRYHGVYRRAERAMAWLAVRATLPGGVGGQRLVLEGDLSADFPDATPVS